MPETINTEGEKVVDAQLDAAGKHSGQDVIFIVDPVVRELLGQILDELKKIEEHTSGLED